MRAVAAATVALGLALGCAETPKARCVPIAGLGSGVCRPDVAEQAWRREMEQGNDARRAGDPGEAERRYRNALAIAPETYPPHPHASATHNNLAALLWKQARLEEAAEQYELSVSEWDQGGQPDDEYIARVLEDQANVLRMLGREAEAVAAEARAAEATDR